MIKLCWVNKVAVDELVEQCAVKPTWRFEIDILNTGRLAQTGCRGVDFEPLLPPESALVSKQQLIFMRRSNNNAIRK
jgi:hypothetical protein